ncbi:hypothetical protein GYN07_27435 (plasmid) [Rhizobium leguminosarum bv. viciae 248]|uniref:hypothetical protein n=1 Tax=Rhizobium leguminosarum TaxID=384 RepID=UPI00036DB1DC|nr:hypothetical protein [Rhizobium leguminosarum]MCA2406567.1 hypothetical protein [Rhizobium leguminosarum]NKM60032.1 hypothetical protein [Rhizobium leguminosarum bv. viciae]QHW28052.1 hypothetical protein GYN07_27435 [Rhizobium leguminosarum bv. viciae 248]
MTFRALNQKYIEPASQYLMILGIIALCQPWNLFLHRYGMTMTLVGLIAFMVTTKIPRDAQPDEGSQS